MCILLSDNTYTLLPNDPTDRVVKKKCSLIKSTGLAKEIEKSITVQHSSPPRLYGRPTIHKEGTPL